jgi:23S rRNA pseudouridine1911/1915/1917 synthase
MPLPEIIHADADLLLCAKPAGQAVARRPGRKGTGPSLTEELHRAGHAQAKPCHHLDLEVSGLAVFALHKGALDYLSGQFQGKTVVGRFEALVVLASPEERERCGARAWTEADQPGPRVGREGVWEWRLIEDPDQASRWVWARRRTGRAVATRFLVAEAYGRFAWLNCWPSHGRADHLRAHLALAGWPALNDALYGLPEAELRLSALKRGYKGRDEEKPLVTQVGLHLGELALRHPATREAVTYTAPLPTALTIARKQLQRYAGTGARRTP